MVRSEVSDEEILEYGRRPLADPRRERFAQALLKRMLDGTGTLVDVYRAAGYGPNMSHGAASVEASRVARRLDVTARVAYLQGQVAKRAEVDGAAAMKRLEAIGRADLRDVAEWGPGWMTLRESAELGKAASASVNAVQFEETVTEIEFKDGRRIVRTRRRRKIQQHDKVRANRLIAESPR